MARDQLRCTILADGQIRIESDAVSPQNHLNAESLLDFLASKAGGAVIVQARTDVEHQHQHDEVRLKQGEAERIGL